MSRRLIGLGLLDHFCNDRQQRPFCPVRYNVSLQTWQGHIPGYVAHFNYKKPSCR